MQTGIGGDIEMIVEDCMFCIWRNGQYECDAKDYGFPCIPDETCNLDDDYDDEESGESLADYDPN